ncbi:TonB-dependent receptor [Mucilaginibacter limnophilus]|uniref:TonB-dependent receptor n=1 Tax=Mucilaginibacter limnophilus TaxID=1932778 RepID=A0A3S2UR61_9SPHI|nr:TonB-dependent receptor [Mucilaginibacter limnophilus]RVU02611.1 TonB-dependent receptor [Mucilaginibacter limnophilus]
MRKIILIFLFIVLALPFAYAQNKTITGSVRDVGGILPGASVVEKGLPTNGTVTDGNGRFKITLRGTSNAIIVRYIGNVDQEVNVAGKTSVDVILAANSKGLDEVVIVGYGKSTRPTNTGSVSSISATEIRTVPTANVQNALTGRLPGFFSQQASGQPGRDASDFFIRGVSSLNTDGNKPLIIVDDIEYTYEQLQQINVNEIENISILKDASTTAVYGVKGANGVLVVTTRRGKSGAPKFNFRLESGIQANTRTPKFLNAYESALLINEAQTNDGLQPIFNNDQLALLNNDNDFDGYPNVDWYNSLFKKNTYQVNSNLDISGGTETVKYFISGGALVQNGLTKDFADAQDLVNTSYNFKRYNFRSNLDLKANKNLTFRFDLTSRFSDLNQPRNLNVLGEVYDFTKITPFSAPFLNPDGRFAYARSQFNPGQLPTINARLATGGYDHPRRTDFNVLVSGTQKLDDFTEGLSVTARLAYSSREEFTKGTVGSAQFPYYYYNPDPSITNEAQRYELGPGAKYVYEPYTYVGGTNIFTTNTNIQFFANYDRTFNSSHHFTGLALFNQTSETYYTYPLLAADRVGVPQKFRGISGKLGYDYKQKFLIDFNAAYNGTDRFAAGKRYGFFPAVGVGYRLDQEEFFKKALPTFSLFKLRGSYGLVGSDAAPNNRYVYLQFYNSGAGYNFGETPRSTVSYSEGNLSNPGVIWEKSRKMDIGLDANFLNNKFSFTFDYFRDIRYDQIIVPKSVSQILGVDLPASNLGKTLNTGFDGQLTYTTSFGKLQFSSGLVFSYAKNTILNMDEPPYVAANRRLTGYSIGQQIGYVSEGYYSQAEVDAAKSYLTSNPVGGGIPVAVPVYSIDPTSTDFIKAGDLKYKDLNGDGLIDLRDQTQIGRPNLPNTNLGLNLGFSYNGFSLSILFQSSFNYSFAVLGTGIEPFQSQFQPIHQERWTPENAENANFPRLTRNPTNLNSPSAYFSDYWLLNAFYLRLKTVDFGYQLPTKMLPFKLNNARIYLSAYNLFTWTNFQKYQQDPEVATNTAGDAYINQRVINLGLQIGF